MGNEHVGGSCEKKAKMWGVVVDGLMTWEVFLCVFLCVDGVTRLWPDARMA